MRSEAVAKRGASILDFEIGEDGVDGVVVERQGGSRGGGVGEGDESDEVVGTASDEVTEGFLGGGEAGGGATGNRGGHVLDLHGPGEVDDHLDGDGVGAVRDIAEAGLRTGRRDDGGGEAEQEEEGGKEAEALAQGLAAGNAGKGRKGDAAPPGRGAEEPPGGERPGDEEEEGEGSGEGHHVFMGFRRRIELR